MTKLKSGSTTSLALVDKDKVGATLAKMREQGLNLPGTSRAKVVETHGQRTGGLPWILFSPGKGEASVKAMLARGGSGDPLGFACVVDGDDVQVLRGGTLDVNGQTKTFDPLMFAIDSFSCYGKSSSDGPLEKASWTPDPKQGLKATSVQGRACGIVLFVDRDGAWTPAFFTMRTGPGRRDGFEKLVDAGELGRDPEWLRQNPGYANIPDEIAGLRCGVQVRFPPVDDGKNKWTGFKGETCPFPPSKELLGVVLDFLDEKLAETMPKLVEWMERELADVVALAGDRPESEAGDEPDE